MSQSPEFGNACVFRLFYERTPEQQEGDEAFTDDCLLLLQCDSGDENGTLIASACYKIMDAYNTNEKAHIPPVGDENGVGYERPRATQQLIRGRKHVVLVIQLPRKLE